MSEATAKASGQVELMTTARGAVSEFFDRGLQQIVDNIADPNTKNKQKRTLTLEFVFSPDDDGEDVDLHIHMKTKLAAVLPAKTRMYVGRRASGKAVAVEFNPRQTQIFPDGDNNVQPLRGVDGGKKS
jgi:hypothetical protein